MCTIIDAQGLSCPQPVILTLNKIEELKTGEIAVIVDNFTARENVIRCAENNGWEVKEIDAEGETFNIKIQK